MKKLQLNTFTLIILMYLPLAALAQTSAPATSPALKSFNELRLDHNKRAMWVLGGWAAANMLIGGVGMFNSQGSNRAFHQMNLGWNAVNLGLAASGLWTAHHTDPGNFDLWQTLLAQQKLQKILLFNAGLDVGYMAAGFWMLERAKNDQKKAERWRGFGRSIILQGAFLFVFDLGAFTYHQRLDNRLKSWVGQSSIGFNSNGIGLKYSF